MCTQATFTDVPKIGASNLLLLEVLVATFVVSVRGDVFKAVNHLASTIYIFPIRLSRHGARVGARFTGGSRTAAGTGSAFDEDGPWRCPLQCAGK